MKILIHDDEKLSKLVENIDIEIVYSKDEQRFF